MPKITFNLLAVLIVFSFFSFNCQSSKSTSIKLDSKAEGYKGIPWNTGFRDFLEYKHQDIVSKYEFEIAYFENPEKENSDLENKITTLSATGEFVGQLIKGFKVLKTKTSVESSFDPSALPWHFKSVYSKADDCAFVFYNSFFVAGIMALDKTAFADVKRNLDEKYKNGNSFDYPLAGKIEDVKSGNNESKLYFVYKFSGRKYFKDKLTDVYVVKSVDKSYEPETVTYGLVYLNRDGLKNMQHDYQELLKNTIKEQKTEATEKYKASIKNVE